MLSMPAARACALYLYDALASDSDIAIDTDELVGLLYSSMYDDDAMAERVDSAQRYVEALGAGAQKYDTIQSKRDEIEDHLEAIRRLITEDQS